jgi:hypothetical protein
VSRRPALLRTYGAMVGDMQVGAVTIAGVSDGSLPVPPTPLFNKTDQDWLQHS